MILGVEAETVEYAPLFVGGRVECVFRLNGEIPKVLMDSGVKPGDRITTAISYRYTEASLQDALAQNGWRGRVFLSSSGHTAVAVVA